MLRLGLAAAAFALVLSCLPSDRALAAGDLTSAQLQQLRELGFAVIPHPTPPGFAVSGFRVSANAYEVDYRRASDGATLKFAGVRGAAPAQTADKPKHHGFFQQIGSQLSGLTNHPTPAPQVAYNNSNTGHELEAEQNDVAADSQAIGPTHFANDGNGCLSGQNDQRMAAPQFRGATFTVSACHLSQPDPLIHAYRTLATVSP